jgi:putative peptidoglycan lipid II flippase
VTFATPIFTILLPGFDPDEIEIVTRMFAIQAPSIILMTINNFHGYIWQHDEQYNRVVFARLSLSLTILIFILGGYYFGNVYALAMGFLGGHIMSALILAYRLPYKFRPTLNVRNPDVRKILTNSAMLTGSGLITKLRGPILQYFGSQLGEGAISAVVIAFKMCRPVHESMLIGVGMIVFSRSSKEAAQGNYKRLASLYEYALSAVLLGVMPIAVWTAVNAESIVTFIFLRGEFTPYMAKLVTSALLGAVAGIVILAVQQMLSNSFYALQKITVPLVVMPLSTIIFFFAAMYLSQAFGIFGLTLAASLVSTTTVMLLLIALSSLLPMFPGATIFGRMVKYFVPSALGAGLGYVSMNALGLTGFLGLAVSFAVTVAVYVAILWLVRDSVYRRVRDSLRYAIAE